MPSERTQGTLLGSQLPAQKTAVCRSCVIYARAISDILYVAAPQSACEKDKEERCIHL